MMAKLRVGILINKNVINLWEYRILKKIMDSEFSYINLIIKNNSNVNGITNEKKSILVKIHNRIDRVIFRQKFDYDKKIDISELIAKTPYISLGGYAKEGKRSWETVLDTISQEVDVILNFGVILPDDSFLPITRFGIWSFIADRDNVILKLLSEDVKSVKNWYGIVGAVIQVLNGKNSPTIINRISSSLYPSSLNVTKDQIYGLAPLVILRMLEEISVEGKPYFDTLVRKFHTTGNSTNPRTSYSLSGLNAAKCSFAIFKKYFYKKAINLNPDPWSLLVDINNEDEFKNKLHEFKELRGPHGTFWADPFVISKNDRHYIFIEEYLYKNGRGHISVLELDNKGSLLDSKVIIEKQSHMSYPFVFELENQYYMIPETLEEKTIELYQCTKFPEKWEFKMNLMDNILATDPTLLFYNKMWWLFVSVDKTEIKTDCFAELSLFYTNDLFSGKWISHPLNPIVTDPHNSRSAGKIFIKNNKIYRPSQDCFWRYGNSLNVNLITRLDAEGFEETLIFKIKPTFDRRFIGVHTFNFDNNITVLDVVSRAKRRNLNPFKKKKTSENTYIISDYGEEPKKIKILFFIDGLTSGGKERRLTELMKELKLKPDFDFEIVLMNKEVHYKVVFDLGIKIYYLIRKTKKDISGFSQFYKICKNYKPDIVHCWDSMTAIYSTPVCKVLKIKLINGMVVDTPVKQNIYNKNWFRARITFPLADTIVGNSKAGLAAYKAPLNRSVCIYNGMDLSRFTSVIEPSSMRQDIFGDENEDIFVIGMVAAFQERKDYKTLIAAAGILIPLHNNIRFVLVGSGSTLEEMKRIVPASIGDKIVFLGSRSDIESIVNIFDIGVLLTNANVHGEGISNSIIEYMAMRKPVIATCGGGTNEVVFDNKTGFLINSENVDQLVEKITVLYNNKILAKEFGNNGRKMVEETFDARIMTKHYEDLYKRIISFTFLLISLDPIRYLTNYLNF